MLARAVRIANVRGVEVRLDPSVLLLGVLVAALFLLRFVDGFSWPLAIPMAAVGALLVMATTFAHELAHALEAQHRGIEVEAITLLLFGGVTEMHAGGQTARDELAIALVGPYVSLLCGAVFGIVATVSPDLLPDAVGAPVAEVAGLLGWWNVLLAAFNIVPGAPLDGGRVLRALMWMITRDRMRALRTSVRAGQLLGLTLVGTGLLLPFVAPLTLLPASVGSVILVVTGVFLYLAARRELRHAELDEVLSGRTVRELLSGLDGRQPPPLEPPPDAVGADTAGVPELPAVQLHADLHALVAAFQGDHDRVRVADGAVEVGTLVERDVARALHEVRRFGAAAGRPEPPAPAAPVASRDVDPM
jgi:Zn-dependent protease